MNEINKEELLNAIDDYDAYPLKQREILKLLINISVNNIAVISSKKISEMVATTKSTTYLSLSKLKDDNVILNTNEKHNTYELNQTRLNEILKINRNKLEYIRKNT